MGLNLYERCSDGYDIYLDNASSLSYVPNKYLIYKNGRNTGISFNTPEEAREYIMKTV